MNTIPHSPRLPWHDVSHFFQEHFGGKVSKILVNTGVPCAYRETTGGCTFCHEESILPPYCRGDSPILAQIRRGIQVREKHGPRRGYIAYFQRGTTTAAPAGLLREWLDLARREPGIVGLAVGTRPDCLPEPALALLGEVARDLPVFVDLGLQTIHPRTLARIRRGHDRECFDKAVRQLAALPGLFPIAHMILMLPGESAADMQASFRHLASLPLHGVKIHHLQVVRGTPLEEEFRRGRLQFMEPAAYVSLLADLLESLPWSFVIHRLLGDQPRQELLAPLWTWQKNVFVDALQREFDRRGTRQGSAFSPELQDTPP